MSLRLTSRLPLSRPLLRLPRLQYSTATSNSDRVPTNTTNPPGPVQNISETNELATSTGGARDAPLQETVEDGEKQRVMQAPNRAGIWSRSQQPREVAMSGPRFEQTTMEYQVCFDARLESIPTRGGVKGNDTRGGEDWEGQDGCMDGKFCNTNLFWITAATTPSRHLPHSSTTRALDERAKSLV